MTRVRQGGRSPFPRGPSRPPCWQAAAPGAPRTAIPYPSLGRRRTRSERPRRRPRPRPTGGSPRAQPAPVVAAPGRPRRRAPGRRRPRRGRLRAVPGAQASPTPTLAPTASPAPNPYTGVTEGQGKGVKLGYLSYGELVPYVFEISEGIRAQAHLAGAELVECDAKLDPSAVGPCMKQLSEAGVKGIIQFQGTLLDPKTVCDETPAGVPVLAVEFAQEPCATTLVSADDLRAGQIAGTAVGQWVKTTWACTYDAYVSFQSTIAAERSQRRMEGYRQGFSAICPITNEQVGRADRHAGPGEHGHDQPSRVAPRQVEDRGRQRQRRRRPRRARRGHGRKPPGRRLGLRPGRRSPGPRSDPHQPAVPGRLRLLPGALRGDDRAGAARPDRGQDGPAAPADRSRNGSTPRTSTRSTPSSAGSRAPAAGGPPTPRVASSTAGAGRRGRPTAAAMAAANAGSAAATGAVSGAPTSQQDPPMPTNVPARRRVAQRRGQRQHLLERQLVRRAGLGRAGPRPPARGRGRRAPPAAGPRPRPARSPATASTTTQGASAGRSSRNSTSSWPTGHHVGAVADARPAAARPRRSPRRRRREPARRTRRRGRARPWDAPGWLGWRRSLDRRVRPPRSSGRGSAWRS